MTPKQKDDLAAEIDVMIREATDMAEKKLEKSWPLVRQVVRHLLSSGSINGEQFSQLREEYRRRETSWAKRTTMPKSKACAILLGA